MKRSPQSLSLLPPPASHASGRCPRHARTCDVLDVPSSNILDLRSYLSVSRSCGCRSPQATHEEAILSEKLWLTRVWEF